MKAIQKRTNNSPLSLRLKIASGYLLLIIFFGAIVWMVWNGKQSIGTLNAGESTMQEHRKTVNQTFEQLLALSFSDNFLLSGDTTELVAYRAKRVSTVATLGKLKAYYSSPEQHSRIDTVCLLLWEKEMLLYKVMETITGHDETYKLIRQGIPYIASQAKKKEDKTQKKKKGGFWRLFRKKGKGEPQPKTPNTSVMLYSLGREVQDKQDEHQKQLEAYADSLGNRNIKLNGKLSQIIHDFEVAAMRKMEREHAGIILQRERSFRTISLTAVAAILLVIVFYIIIHRDITQKFIYRRKLEASDRKKEELLEAARNMMLTISHDIRAPLSIINGSAELAMDTRDKKRRNMHLTNIRLVCKHVLHLLNNLLDVYRLNEAKETCNNVPFSLKELLERIASGFSHLVNNKGILFQCDFKNTDTILNGDMDRIEQIIDNLLTNALKFTEAGTIVFYADYENGWLSLKIKDTGIGMNDDTLSRIFRPFERLSSEMNSDGFGLGLPITKGLVKLLGGTIDVESEIGHGSTFHVSLPLPVSSDNLENNNAILQKPAVLPQQVLVIDNDPLQLEIVKEMLERSGVICTTCSNVKDLVREMRKKDYDLLLSDIQMSGTNGFEVLALLRNSNIGNSRTIPVIAMTARGDREKYAFIESGFTDCIYKPFSMSELLNHLSAIVYHKEEEEQQSSDFVAFTAEVRDKRKLLRSFISQSRQDIKDLQTAQKTENLTELLELVHRMMPTWELLQSDELLLDFRAALKNSAPANDSLEEYTKQITEQAATLIREAENEIRRLTDEAENTDS